jgi:hypothetical protein
MPKELAMRTTPLVRLDLERSELFDAGDASGVDFTCHEGTVWLTLDGDLRDYVLEAGDSFRTSDHRRALVYALEPARVDLATCKRRKPAARSRRIFGLIPAIHVAR